MTDLPEGGQRADDEARSEKRARVERLERCCREAGEYGNAVLMLLSQGLGEPAGRLAAPFLLKAARALLSLRGAPALPASLEEAASQLQPDDSPPAALLKAAISRCGQEQGPGEDLTAAILDGLRSELRRVKKEELTTAAARERRAWMRVIAAAVLTALALAAVVRHVRLRAERAAFLASSQGQSVRELTVLRRALGEYYRENGSYPSTRDRTDGYRSCWGKSTADWIPDLAPRYVKELPRDPRKNDKCDEQYFYMSDGKSYKLLAHKGLYLSEVRRLFPEMIDPRRPGYAYGFWSAAGFNR